jgi:hypothetical protein
LKGVLLILDIVQATLAPGYVTATAQMQAELSGFIQTPQAILLAQGRVHKT